MWVRSVKVTILLSSLLLLAVVYGLGLPGTVFSFLGMSSINSEIRRQARSLASTLSLEEKCASVLLVAYGGAKQLVPEFASRYQKIPVGGVILFAYNIPQTAEELMDLTDGIRRVGNETARIPFIAVDHEGGTVFRLQGIATKLPDAREIGRSRASHETVLQLYRNIARQLASLGFSMNLAPVVEPLTEETRPFLSRRTFSTDPTRITELSEQFLQAMREAGVVGVAKHYPGSGDEDPHEELPKSSARPSDPADPYTLPFRSLHGKGVLDAVMVSHVRVPRAGVQGPASLSPVILQNILREQWRFEGLILTDDMRMKSITQREDPIEGVVRSIQAGADMVMYLGGEYPKAHEALVRAVREGRLSPYRLDEAVTRILAVKIRYGVINPRREEPVSKAERLGEFYRLKREGDVMVQQILKGRLAE